MPAVCILLLLQGRPQLVAGDAIYVRLEADRTLEASDSDKAPTEANQRGQRPDQLANAPTARQAKGPADVEYCGELLYVDGGQVGGGWQLMVGGKHVLAGGHQ